MLLKVRGAKDFSARLSWKQLARIASVAYWAPDMLIRKFSGRPYLANIFYAPSLDRFAIFLVAYRSHRAVTYDYTMGRIGLFGCGFPSWNRRHSAHPLPVCPIFCSCHCDHPTEIVLYWCCQGNPHVCTPRGTPSYFPRVGINVPKLDGIWILHHEDGPDGAWRLPFLLLTTTDLDLSKSVCP